MQNDERETEPCGNCAGSGEGMVDGSICSVCRGMGEVTVDEEEI